MSPVPDINSRYREIRQALAETIQEADGITKCEEYPPNDIKTNGTAWVGFFRTIETQGMSGRVTWTHRVPVTIVANRNMKIGEATTMLEPVLIEVLSKLKGNQTLGLAAPVDHVITIDWEQGMWEIGGSTHVGFQIRLDITERLVVTYD